MNIFVGCGSRIPKNEEYCSLAEEIGRAIVEKKDNFVFGAYNHGLMGIIYQTVEKSKNSSVVNLLSIECPKLSFALTIIKLPS